ncbi:MAG TPA: lipase family protein [Methanocellales archaeon]|nr:lipase family protein [Methanocellales archaeon]
MVWFFDAKSTQCFVASNDDFIIVAFRGTETNLGNKQPNYADIVYDLLTDVRVLLVPYEGGGLVHEGFKQALEEVWLDREIEGQRIIGLKSYLDELSTQKARPVWFTGHSLGAALATLAAERYGKARGLYTFGSPRVGNMEFKDHYKLMHYRFVNNDDLCTRVPPEAFSYRHVGNVIFIGSSGRIGYTPLQMDSSKDTSKNSIDDVVKSVEQIKRQSSGTIPSWLLNHIPVLYSTHIWNNYVWSK